jgi:predicted nucleotidyltransferase component of viral defense system
MKESPYFAQASLMLRVMPHVAAEDCFALKGGTAINLFVRDMPRLSVDIDLTYLPAEAPREAALQSISDALRRIASAVEKAIPGANVQETRANGSARIVKLVVTSGRARIKVEPNEVLRGAVFPVEARDLVPKAEALFEMAVTARTLSVADLYGGKICAALDRQHPRDLFDIKLLLDAEGITDDIRRAFVIYLASHDRPMNELLDPVRKDIQRAFDSEFAGMAAVDVTCEELITAREVLIKSLLAGLSPGEKEFLISLKARDPKWESLSIEGMDKLPAIQWKLQNLRRMEGPRHSVALERLKAVLSGET